MRFMSRNSTGTDSRNSTLPLVTTARFYRFCSMAHPNEL